MNSTQSHAAVDYLTMDSRALWGWVTVVTVPLLAVLMYEITDAAADNRNMPPFLVLFLLAEGVVAYTFSARHAVALLIAVHVVTQLLFAPSAPSFDALSGNPTVLLRVMSFVVTGLIIIALIDRLKRQNQRLLQAHDSISAMDAQMSGMVDQTQLLRMIDQAPVPISLYAVDGKPLFWNRALLNTFEIQPELLPSIYDSYNLLEDENVVSTGLIPLVDKAITGEPARTTEPLKFEVVPEGFPLGTTASLWLDASIFPITDIHGVVTQIAIFMNDRTPERNLLHRLERGQKLESIGQLTGGVAHDFNNLLTVVIGNLELMKLDLGGDQNSRDRMIDQAFDAARRGADLTRKLLAFSRKQALEPKVVDIRSLISNMHDLLIRTIGEDVAIEVVNGAGLWRCEVDVGQLENLILNLAINSRDAMPDGGNLTIETGNAFLDDEYALVHPGVKAGQYVMLAVSDTGSGMTDEVKEKAFEPFYSTKGPGKGSGLGLSMSFGFIKQTGGHIEIYSEIGEGTTIKTYLPRSMMELDNSPEVIVDEEPQGAGETILLVEDDDDIRTMAADSLQRLGYRVVTAGDASSALDQLAGTKEIQLILSDVILAGGMNGPQLARQAILDYPTIRVLYMSGYTENAIIHDGKLDPGVELLQKPFTRLQLARKVRKALRG